MADEPVDFRDLLAKPLGDFPDRPSLPGNKTFFGKLVSIGAGVSSQKGTPFFRFDARLTDGGQDVKKSDLDAIVAAGFGLGDYDVWAEFYLTPGAMPMLRSFLESIGFSGSSTFKEALKLNDSGEPTAESQDAIRGLDIICRTQAPGDNGRVYGRLASMAGSKTGPTGSGKK